MATDFNPIRPLPVEIVFHPSWWNKHCGIVFDEDFFYHPLKRVECERRMEDHLYERFGRWGLGRDHGKDLPQIGAIHQAAGYLLSEMLGCDLRYIDNAAPQVICANRPDLTLDTEAAFQSPAFKRLEALIDNLKAKYGYVCGDINWSGVLNLALDVRGQEILLDMMLQPDETKVYFGQLAAFIERFFNYIQSLTGSNSVSVNRNVLNIDKPVYLHSECSNTMISEDQYEEFLLPIDTAWSLKYRPFGIHYCGPDPHRHAEKFAQVPHLDFLDAGWGGDIKVLRQHLPNTFLNLRIDAVSINTMTCEELEGHIRRLVADSGNLALTGLCCINMDDKVTDDKVDTIFRVAEELRKG